MRHKKKIITFVILLPLLSVAVMMIIPYKEYENLLPAMKVDIKIEVEDRGTKWPLVGYELYRDSKLCISEEFDEARSNDRGELKMYIPVQKIGYTITIWDRLIGKDAPESVFEIRYKGKTLFILNTPSILGVLKLHYGCAADILFAEEFGIPWENRGRSLPVSNPKKENESGK